MARPELCELRTRSMSAASGGYCFREELKFVVRRIARTENEPGNGPVVGVRRGNHRLVGVFRILAHLLQATNHVDDGLLHFGADPEFQRDASQRVGAFGRHLGDALDTLELFFLLHDDLLLHFLRAGPRPTCLDRDRRRLHLGGQLHRHPRQRDPAEDGHQQHADQHFRGIPDKEVN